MSKSGVTLLPLKSKFRSFASDNHAGVHPDIMRAILEVNSGSVHAYGDDEYTEMAVQKFKEHFGQNIDVYFVFNGTAANTLGLAEITKPFNSIICSEMAHINTSECGAPEKFSGCKLITVPRPDGKLTVESVKNHMQVCEDQHISKPKVISITQATEVGTVYKPSEIKEISDFAHRNDLLLHMDGARLCNAAASLGVSLKEITANVGVDVLSFGGTKNGCMLSESVVFLNKDLSKDFKFTRKQGMQLASKMRFISAQFIALLSDDLWLRNAEHANKMAKLLEKEIRQVPQIKLTQEVETNGVFAILPKEFISTLQEQFYFYIWDEKTSEVRLMTSFATSENDIQEFVRTLKEVVK